MQKLSAMSKNIKPPKIKVTAPAQNAVISMLNDHQQNLSIELAAKLESVKDILKRYNITQNDFRILAKDPHFQQQCADAKIAWGSPMNAKERVQAKTAMMTEASLLRINQLIMDSSTPPSNVIAAHQHISGLARMAPGKGDSSEDGGSKHSIVINIGKSEGRTPITVQGAVVDDENE